MDGVLGEVWSLSDGVGGRVIIEVYVLGRSQRTFYYLLLIHMNECKMCVI